MGGGGQQTEHAEPGSGKAAGVYTWEDVQKHRSRNDQWLVVNRKVYNISQWVKRHPGGIRIISHYAGEDATEAFTAFHPDLKHVQKFLKPLLVGDLAATEPSQDGGKNKEPTVRVYVLLHRDLILGLLANWWNHRHFQHHAKPNIFKKDPDVNMLDVFVLGNTQPVEYGIKKIKHMPYNHQHKYFFLVGPPLLIPIYFHMQIMKTMITRRDWWISDLDLNLHKIDLAWSFSYYFRYFFCYTPLYGFLGSLALMTFVRFLESHWFVWVTQMNHLPMEIQYETNQDWLTMQGASANWWNHRHFQHHAKPKNKVNEHYGMKYLNNRNANKLLMFK
uniref:acyl-CoA (8-3)-desaturase n=1 Tax=Fundulus heteroclitus TaxID=8078 RepID=A0A3Q2NR99_FUNHE